MSVFGFVVVSTFEVKSLSLVCATWYLSNRFNSPRKGSRRTRGLATFKLQLRRYSTWSITQRPETPLAMCHSSAGCVGKLKSFALSTLDVPSRWKQPCWLRLIAAREIDKQRGGNAAKAELPGTPWLGRRHFVLRRSPVLSCSDERLERCECKPADALATVGHARIQLTG